MLGGVGQLSRCGGDRTALVRELIQEIVLSLKPGSKPALGKSKNGSLDTPGKSRQLRDDEESRTRGICLRDEQRMLRHLLSNNIKTPVADRGLTLEENGH